MQITYNGLQGPVIVAGGITFETGKPVEVENPELAAALCAKPYFTAATAPTKAPAQKEG